ncbi:MAG: site-specific DNA-methyltransferase [Bryobacteraceae bacterium]
MPELIWDAKYQGGKRNGPVRIELPFQTVETVNESAQDRQRSLELFASGRDAEWRNRLIWGDKKYILPSLLPEFAGKVDLIYIDPPFDTGADFSFTAKIPDYTDASDDDTAAFTKEPSMLEQKAYRDTWGVSREDRQRGVTHVDRYLKWFYETIILLRELLAEGGSLYVHLDWHVGHYAKVALDEVFGGDACQNEIIWKRTSARSDSTTFNHVHDVIFLYASGEFTFNDVLVPLDPAYVADKYKYVDKSGRRYMLDNMTSPNPRPNMTYVWRGHQPPALGWRYSKETMQRLHDEGRIWYPDSKDKRPRLIRFESDGQRATSVWTDISPVNSQAGERVNYDTQKPEALLQRVIRTSSNEGDLVLDCFAGSGTTAVVSEKLGRRWIACDLSRFAIHTTRKTLLSIPSVRPFAIQNLGKYERQAWQGAEFPNPEDQRAREAAYRNFILDLYRASPMSGRAWLHGTKSGRFVHVGAVDAPVTLADVKAVAAETWKAVGSGQAGSQKAAADILGWEFAFELNETARDVTAQARVDIVFRKIPREVLEKKAIEQGDIRFFELAALKVTLKQKKREATLELADFVVPPDDVPEDVRAAIKHWSQWIDYWAVDWDYKGDTFHNQWQSYRTQKEPRIETKCSHVYDVPGSYIVVAKVIDILGNDTTKTIAIEVR